MKICLQRSVEIAHQWQKIFLVMQITLILTLLTLFQVSAMDSKAQQITLRVNNKSLIAVFKEIRNQSGHDFFYNLQVMKTAKPVSINVRNQPLEKVLAELLKNQPFVYTIDDGIVVIKEKIINDGLYGRISDLAVSGQQIITGRVTDKEGNALADVSIHIKGTSIGTTSDQQGYYSLTNNATNAVLVFSILGYTRQEITLKEKDISANGSMTINVSLINELEDLDEVVVVGYGSVKKVNLTGAVDVISNDQLKNRQAGTVSQILQGQSPGMSFSVGRSGLEPGASMDINIRGIGSLNGGQPYVLIDGFPGSLDMLNAEDIESISILKDAAASAIYGARAPYGVILVSTKSGKRNHGPEIAYSANASVNSQSRLPSMLDSYTFARVTNEMGVNGGGRPYSNENIQRIIAYQNKDWDYLKQFLPADATHFETLELPGGRWAHTNNSYANYDWYEEFYGNSFNQNHTLSVQGGSDKVGYYLSGGFSDQNGVLKYGVDTYRRYNVTGKVDISLTGWWNVRYETRFIKSPREHFNAGANPGAGESGYELLFRQISRAVPTQAKYDPYGNYSLISNISSAIERGTDRRVTTDNWQAFATELRPARGWKINADFAYNSIGIDRSNQNLTIDEPYAGGRIVPLSLTVPNMIQQFVHNNYYWVTNAYTSYEAELNNAHHVYVMAGTQFEYDRKHLINVSKTSLVVEDVPSLQTANGDVTASESLVNWSTQGYFSRFMYNYNEKYLLEANVRVDGTSRFVPGNQWGFFPSFSAGWNVDKERFWRPVTPYVDKLKFRASWGQLGNQLVDPYQDLALIPLYSDQIDWISNFGESRRIGYTGTPALVSPRLTWEVVTTKNLGLDASLLKSRLTVTADIYERVTENMIGPSEPLPGVLGVNVPASNNASLRTRGWELSVRWNQRNAGNDFSYSIGFNVQDSRTFILDYLNPTGLVSSWYKGKEVGEIWGFTSHGLFQTQAMLDDYLSQVNLSNINNSWNVGDVKYEDINGDGKVDRGANTLANPGDQTIIGNSSPRYQYGISGDLQYRSVDFSFLIRGTPKRDFFFATGNNNIRFWGVRTIPFTSMTPAHLDYFRDTEGDANTGLHAGEANINTGAFWPKPYLNAAQNDKNRHPSTRYLADASYIRLQNVQLGYTLRAGLLKKYGIKKFRLYLSGENLLTFTNLLKGIDPVALEGFGGGAGVTYGADRMFSMGLNLSF